MKKNLLTKIRNRKGFTLAELLIVVAIIGVLVAISIPIFTSQLKKAKVATNEANVRSAKAAAVAMYLSDAKTGEVTYSYDVKSGKATVAATGAKSAQSNDTLTTILVKVTSDDTTNNGEAETDPAISSITTDSVYGTLATFGN